MKSGMAKIGLLAISLNVLACSQLPPFPEIYQCAWDGNPRAFYCVNTVTKERKKLQPLDATMKGAQCLSLEDYRRSEEWVETIKTMAERRCK